MSFKDLIESKLNEKLSDELSSGLEEKVKTTHKDPIVLVYKDGKSNAVGQMNLSTACRMHDVKCDASKLHKAGVDKKVKVGKGYSFALSPQHEKMLDESLDEARGDIKTFKTLEDWLMAVLSIKGATVSKSGDSLRANGLGRGGSATFELKKGRGSLLESTELAEVNEAVKIKPEKFKGKKPEEIMANDILTSAGLVFGRTNDMESFDDPKFIHAKTGNTVTVMKMGRAFAVSNSKGDTIQGPTDITKLRAWLKSNKMSTESIEEEKEECPKCEGAGCDHCDDKGYHVTEAKKLDPVGKEDDDIDNDGDVDDSDEYLKKRRGAIKKAISRSKEKKESKKQFMYAAKSAKEDGEKEFVFAGKTYKVEDVEGI